MAVLQRIWVFVRQITRLSRQLQELLPPPKAARAVGLLYVQDTEAGIKRVRRGTGFVYLNVRSTRSRSPRFGSNSRIGYSARVAFGLDLPE